MKGLSIILATCATAGAETPVTEQASGKNDYFAGLLQDQTLAAAQPIFDADTFPKIDFPNKALITGALGPYELRIRYFDAAYNEVQKPNGPGRYGARVEVSFANGFSEIEQVTLFKTSKPFRGIGNTYQVTAQFPEAFGLSDEVLAREEWSAQDFFFRLIRNANRDGDATAALVASLKDMEADPGRWHGFSFRHVNREWWEGLERKLVGPPPEYKRIVTLPDGYNEKPDQHWPMILFLHGAGSRGDDLDKLKAIGPLGHIQQGHPLPFIVVTPQCPRKEAWSPERLARLVDEMVAQHRVDPKRVYVTGLSMGGYGTFDLAATFPQRFAAIAPLSGGGEPDIAERLKAVPTWIFHGEEDVVVPAHYSIRIADKLKAVGATEVKLTLYPGIGHEKWSMTYGDPALYEWFLKHALP